MTVDLPDDFYKRLVEHRGGCRCTWPDAHPPCGACTNEMSDAEATEVLQSFIGEKSNQWLIDVQTALLEDDYTAEL